MDTVPSNCFQLRNCCLGPDTWGGLRIWSVSLPLFLDGIDSIVVFILILCSGKHSTFPSHRNNFQRLILELVHILVQLVTVTRTPAKHQPSPLASPSHQRLHSPSDDKNSYLIDRATRLCIISMMLGTHVQLHRLLIQGQVSYRNF